MGVKKMACLWVAECLHSASCMPPSFHLAVGGASAELSAALVQQLELRFGASSTLGGMGFGCLSS